MIDVENALYTDVRNAINDICKSGTSEVATPSSFPYVSFVQKDNPIYEKTSTSTEIENHVKPMIQIDVYSEKSKTECKTICSKVDDVMKADGFTRTFGYEPTVNGPNYWRFTARYTGVVSRNANNEFTVHSK